MTLLGEAVLKRRFAEEKGASAALAAVDQQVVRRIWTTSSPFLPEVLPGAERALSDLRWLDAPGTNERYNEYGFDDQARIVRARSIVPEEGVELVDEQLTVTFNGQRAFGARYNPRHDQAVPVAVWTSLEVTDHIVAFEVFFRHVGYEAYEYRWHAGRPTLRTTTRADGSTTTESLAHDDTQSKQSPAVDRATLLALLVRDVRLALERIFADDRSLVWIGYSGDGDDWQDAAHPHIAVTSTADLASLVDPDPDDGWRAGWDLTKWRIAERDVELGTDTQQALGTASGPLSEVDELLRDVAAALVPQDGSQGPIFIAVDDELEQLQGALERLPERDATQLRDLGLAPRAG